MPKKEGEVDVSHTWEGGVGVGGGGAGEAGDELACWEMVVGWNGLSHFGIKGGPGLHDQSRHKHTNTQTNQQRTDEHVLEAEERRALLVLPLLLQRCHRLKVRARHFLYFCF